MPHPDFHKYNPTSDTPWKAENPGRESKALGDVLFENLRDSVRTANLESAERQAGGINDDYYNILANRFLDSLGEKRFSVTPELIQTVFTMVDTGHPPLLAMYHGDERRDRPVEARTDNAQEQTRLLKEKLLQMLSDTK